MSLEPLFVVTGVVEHGRGCGKGMGFPTANVALAPSDLIPYGVYVSKLITQDKRAYYALTNVGVHPTVTCKSAPILEAYVLMENVDLYGQKVRVELWEFLRAEEKFSSREELIAQIRRDVEIACNRIQEKSV